MGKINSTIDPKTSFLKKHSIPNYMNTPLQEI